MPHAATPAADAGATQASTRPAWAPEAAYRALLARDARFDGRLFVGVTSTGVYCRPVCRVRTPKAENCRFFHTPAQAEAAAFRPCMKCRPEIAPGWSHTDAASSLAGSAALVLNEALHAGAHTRLSGLAQRLGISDRHLRRIFQQTHGVSPRDYLATQRLLLAKHLLTDTDWPITQVALASGFDSLRRFNAAFAERYRLPPSRLRQAGQGSATRQAGEAPTEAGHSALRLAWRPPYDLAAMLHFLQRRALPGVELVQGLVLRRTLRWPMDSGPALQGWLQLHFHPEHHELRLSAAPVFAPVLGALLRRVRHALDLDADPEAVDNVLQRLPLPLRPGTRLPGSFDPFETAVRVVLGQQVTVQAARTLTQRLVARFGEPLQTPFGDLDRLFPSAANLAAANADSLGELGIVRQRVKALQALAGAVASGQLDLSPQAPLQATLQTLLALPGIGPWTAQLIALRVLAWPDAWPASDIGLLNALGSRDVAATTAQAEAWRPWRSYAVVRLWTALEPPP
jgi:AraC family transcriptional regulator of adaptative response / DNA-3-methyladenine glycosylase II